VKDVLKFRTNEGRACVSGINMQPERMSFTDDSELVYVIERTHRCSTERRAHLYTCHADSISDCIYLLMATVLLLMLHQACQTSVPLP